MVSPSMVLVPVRPVSKVYKTVRLCTAVSSGSLEKERNNALAINILFSELN